MFFVHLVNRLKTVLKVDNKPKYLFPIWEFKVKTDDMNYGIFRWSTKSQRRPWTKLAMTFVQWVKVSDISSNLSPWCLIDNPANFLHLQVLSVQQLYRISTMYWDDKYSTHSVSNEVCYIDSVSLSLDLFLFIGLKFCGLIGCCNNERNGQQRLSESCIKFIFVGWWSMVCFLQRTKKRKSPYEILLQK